MLELALRPSLADIMREAHAGARAIGPRLPYVDRLSLTLRRAWRRARAAVMRSLRDAIETRVERLLAFLDHLDGDTDLEPWLAGPQKSEALDAEDDGDDLEDGGDTEPNGDELDGPDDNGIADQAGMAEQLSARRLVEVRL